MGALKLLTAMFSLSFFYILVWVLFLPTRILLFFGSIFTPHSAMRTSLFFSDEKVQDIRDDLANSFSIGVDKILEENYPEYPSMSRHLIRQEGLKAVEKTESRLNEGEFLVSLLFAILGLTTSAVSISPSIQSQLFSLFGKQSPKVITALSISTAFLALLILVLVHLRTTVVDSLTYGVGDFTPGSSSDLIMKMHWNAIFSGRPSKFLQIYYVMLATSIIGESVYENTLEVFQSGMNPNVSKKEALEEYLPKIIDSIINEIENG